MSFSQKVGLFSCVLLVVSLFINWAWYPDLQKHFSAFFTEGNHYGKPGIWLSLVSGFGIIFYLVNKPWSQRLNLIMSALTMAYAIRTFLLFTSGYDGFVPEPKAGIYLMLAGTIGHLVGAWSALAVAKKEV